MTRLKTTDIYDIAHRLDDYDAELQRKTGRTLRQLAIDATGHNESHMKTMIAQKRVMVIPMTCGKGIIKGFSETLSAIVEHLGFTGNVTTTTDAAGIAEAIEKEADIIILADDNRFIAVNLKTRGLSDNSLATGKGFATGLMLMSVDNQQSRVLVLGLGPVGQSAAGQLLKRNRKISVFDIDEKLSNTFASELQKLPGADVAVTTHLPSALSNHKYIIDATPAPDIIDISSISNNSVIAAPGVPLGVTREARKILSDRLLHDPLQIGTATMILDAIECEDPTLSR